MIRPTATASIRRRQRADLFLRVIAVTLNYLDRSTLSIAHPTGAWVDRRRRFG
jgi:hypothetical protein